MIKSKGTQNVWGKGNRLEKGKERNVLGEKATDDKKERNLNCSGTRLQMIKRNGT